MRFRSRLCAWALGCGWCLEPRSLLANGRFPAASQLLVAIGDDQHLVARTTFGVLESFDGAASWSWICEGAISNQGFVDPEMVLNDDGSVLVALTGGVSVGNRAGCDWKMNTTGFSGQDVVDLVEDPAKAGHVYAAISAPAKGALAARIAESTDGGQSWSTLGSTMPDTFPITIEVAPSRSGRLYLGSTDGNVETGTIAVSDDNGTTWTPHPSPAGPDAVYVSGVDPVDADRVYVRSYGPPSSLFVSDDAGASWRAVHRSDHPLVGFALSPDGSKIAVGDDATLVVLSRSETDGGTFSVTRTRSLHVGCLTWSPLGLFACATESADGFSLGRSTDEGATFAPLLRFAMLAPASCPATSIAARCSSIWCSIADTLGAACTGENRNDGGEDADVDVASAVSDASSDAQHVTDADATLAEPAESSSLLPGVSSASGGCQVCTGTVSSAAPFLLFFSLARPSRQKRRAHS
jgi:photosystem II stability/assembly factor-like uncharacterized protein